MTNPRYFSAVTSLVLSFAYIAAGQADSVNVFLPAGLTPVYENPSPGELPRSYLEPADTCRPDGSFVDSLGVVWVSVRCAASSGWVRESSLRRPSAQEAVRGQTASKKMDPDMKRRYRVLEQHPDWPRRIVKAVREGMICLDMSEEQLAAAWGEPAHKGRAFILGAGSYDLWYFPAAGGAVQSVFLVKGRVVGWTEK
jgi:hypothetical protein